MGEVILDDQFGARKFLKEGIVPVQAKNEKQGEMADKWIWKARMVLAWVKGTLEDIIEKWR